MKRILTTTIALFLITIGFTQVKINPKIGMNFSNFTQNDNIFQSTGSFGFGAGVDVKIGGRLFFAPGLFYLSSNTEIKKIEDIDINDVANFQTIEMPLTLGFNIINKDNFAVGIKAGIEGAYFASIKEVAGISKDDYERLNWGFQFGAGVDIKKISFDLKFDLGKNASFKESFTNGVNPQYNRFHIYLGYII